MEVSTLEDPGYVPTDDGGRIPVRYKDYVDVFSKDMGTLAPHLLWHPKGI